MKFRQREYKDIGRMDQIYLSQAKPETVEGSALSPERKTSDVVGSAESVNWKTGEAFNDEGFMQGTGNRQGRKALRNQPA